MVFVDTSVWVEASRRPSGTDATRLNGLLDADEVGLALPVRLELVAGLPKRHRKSFRHGLAPLPVAHPTEDTWELVESWVELAADAGHTFGLPDLLISALAHERTAMVWSLDSDFAVMEKLGFIQRY